MAGECFDIPFVVCSIESDGILGQDFLKQHVDSINYKHSSLVIGNTSVPLWTGGQANQICRVEIQETVRLPGYTRKLVSVKIPQKEHLAPLGCVEPSFELMAKKEVCIMGGIVDVTASSLSVTLLNFGSGETTIYKNTNLGTCESYFESTAPTECISVVQCSKQNNSLPEHLQNLYERSSTHLSPDEKEGLCSLLCKYQNVFF